MRFLISIILIVASSWADAAELPAGEIPNLSVTLPDTSQNLNRARRQRVLELTGLTEYASQLDELDQDRLYMNRLRAFIEPVIFDEPAPHAPKTGKTILFFDLNFAPSEITAAKAAAQARGDDFLIYPERTDKQQSDIEQKYRALVTESERYKKCMNSGGDCSAIQQKLDRLRKDLEVLLSSIPRLDKNSIGDIVARLHRDKVRLSAVIFSGHSAGEGTFGGLFGFLAAEDFKTALVGHEEILGPLKSILLWGCYSGTLHSLHEVWQKHFPNLRALMGYRNMAPLGIRESSGTLLKSFLLTEARLIAPGSIPTRHKIFRGLKLVADLDGTAAVDDAYYTYDQAAPIKDLIERCDSFDTRLVEQYQCYNLGQPGCENPPADHRGPLRTFYNFLQKNRHCGEVLKNKYGWLPDADTVIRLIYIDNIKANFKDHYEKYFSAFNDFAADAGVSLRMEKFVGSSRKEDMRNLRQADTDLATIGHRDFTYLDRPNWRSLVAVSETLWATKFILMLHQMVPTCVPFSWVDPGAPEPATCGFQDFLIRPPTKQAQEAWTRDFYLAKRDRFIVDLDPTLKSLVYFQFPDLSQVKSVRHLYLKEAVDKFKVMPNPSPTELARLSLYERMLLESDVMSPAAHRDLLVTEVQSTINYLHQLTQQAQAEPLPDMTLRWLKVSLDEFQELLNRLNSL